MSLRTLRASWGELSDNMVWDKFIKLVVTLCLAESGVVLHHDAQVDIWSVRNNQQKKSSYLLEVNEAFIRSPVISSLVARAKLNQFAVHMPTANESAIFLAISLTYCRDSLLVLSLPLSVSSRLSEILLRAQLVADLPCSHQADDSTISQSPIIPYFNLLIDVYDAKRFSTAIHAIANGLVTYDQEIDLVGLGWVQDAYVKLSALSHVDRLDTKTETIKFFETALEESVDQKEAIWLEQQTNQRPQDLLLVTKANQQLRHHLDAESVFTLSLDDKKGKTLCGLTLVRYKGSFNKVKLNAIHFMLSLLLPRLIELKEKDSSFVDRARNWLFTTSSKLLGKEYLWIKLISVVVSIALLWGIFGKLSHRIEGVAQLTTDSTQVVSAPFDGYVRAVSVTSGDSVEDQSPLINLDTSEIYLQLIEYQADAQRYQAEIDKARASFNVIDTEISTAKKAQVEAKIERANFYLAQSSILAPFAGTVVEGEKKDLLGLPVKKGQFLLKIARVEGMYLSIEVPQEDVHFVHEGDTGEFAFVSQPDQPIAFKVITILPVASTRSQIGAVFLVKAEINKEAESWWRPGMTGVAKIDVGDKTAIWVLLHKVWHKLSLYFWW